METYVAFNLKRITIIEGKLRSKIFNFLVSDFATPIPPGAAGPSTSAAESQPEEITEESEEPFVIEDDAPYPDEWNIRYF